MVTVLCNDSEIEVEGGVVCEMICGLELEEFDQVTAQEFMVLTLDMRYSVD